MNRNDIQANFLVCDIQMFTNIAFSGMTAELQTA